MILSDVAQVDPCRGEEEREEEEKEEGRRGSIQYSTTLDVVWGE